MLFKTCVFYNDFKYYLCLSDFYMFLYFPYIFGHAIFFFFFFYWMAIQLAMSIQKSVQKSRDVRVIRNIDILDLRV